MASPAVSNGFANGTNGTNDTDGTTPTTNGATTANGTAAANGAATNGVSNGHDGVGAGGAPAHGPSLGSPIGDTGPEPIAIVGAACRFSGIASNQDGLWQLLSKGLTSWSRNARNRFKMESFWHPHAQLIGSVRARRPILFLL